MIENVKRDNSSGALIARRNESAIQQARKRKLLMKKTQLQRTTQEDLRYNVSLLAEKFEKLEEKYHQILERLKNHERILSDASS